MSAQAVVDSPGIPSGEEPRTIVHWFRHQVSARPDQAALHFRAGDTWDSISWSQFGNDSRRISAFLVKERVRPGSHVAIWSNNRPEWHIADVAVLCARAVPVPVYLTFSSEQGEFVLKHSESRVVVVENEAILARVLEVRAHLPKLKRVVVFEGVDKPSPDDFVLPWEEALARGEAALGKMDREVDRRTAEVSLDDVATLIYTSGTTGPPKAVQITHRNLEAANRSLGEIFDADENDRLLSYLPLAHIVERLTSEFRSYRYGNATWFLDGLEHLGKRLSEIRPTVFFGVPRVWEKMQQRLEKGVASEPFPRGTIARWAMRVARRYDEAREAGNVPTLLEKQHQQAERMVLSKLRAGIGLDQARYLVSGAAPIRADTLRFFRSIGLPISEGYGQSENTAITAMNPPGKQRIGTVGAVSPGVEVKIAEDGEILMRGEVVFPGYYKDNRSTKKTVDSDGWLHTGDIGELSDDGYLKITGRKKDLIITAGGKNISPSNIEAMLCEHSLIGHAVAIGDQRPFVSALVVLDAEEAPAWARENGVDDSDLGAVAKNSRVDDAVAAHVRWVNGRLSQVEQVKQWTVLQSDFTVGEELTPTLKVKRKVVAEKYATDIEEMYARRKGD
ncbi:MAG: AMP-dependent synthetase/ligase [Candidatus Dormibacteria bacterium]